MARDLERLLREVRKARAEFEARLDDVEIAKDEYYVAVRRLHASGMPLREIADALGLSHQRVHQMIGETEGSKRLRRAVTKAARSGGTALLCLALVGGGWLTARTFERDGDSVLGESARDGISKTPEDDTPSSGRLRVAPGELSELMETIGWASRDLDSVARELDARLQLLEADRRVHFAAGDLIDVLEGAVEAVSSEPLRKDARD